MKKEYGLNHGLNITNNNILMTRKDDPNKENVLILGQTGVGMSFYCKKQQIDKLQKTISEEG